MSNLDMTEQRLDGYSASPGHMITAQTFLIDRIVPDCEVIALPSKMVSGGTLKFGTIAKKAPPARVGGFKKLLRRASPPVETDGRLNFEFRERSPQNWAHFLNNHLPIYFHICDQMGLDWADTVLVMPANTPSYIVAAAEMFGLSIVKGDGPLNGPTVDFQMSPWGAVRTVRSNWVRTPRVAKAVADAVANAAAQPDRIFLARRGTRALSNMDEVEGFLKQRGFVTVYPEDLSVVDQFRLFHATKTIVAVHGAGLAPLLYRPADHGVQQLVEIMPCGHVTDVFRVMAEQVGCAWISVRGRIKPKYVVPSYNFADPYRAYSLDSFVADTASLETAFAMAQFPIGISHE